MKAARTVALAIATSLVLTGCASTRVRLASDPEDARIYVDGELQGTGVAALEVGPEYDYPKSYHVMVKREGYQTLERTLSNEPDYSRAGLNFGLLVGLGILNAFFWAQDRDLYFGNGVAALVSFAVSPTVFFNSNKFRKAYEFELEKR